MTEKIERLTLQKEKRELREKHVKSVMEILMNKCLNCENINITTSRDICFNMDICWMINACRDNLSLEGREC